MSTFRPPVGYPLRDLPAAHAASAPQSVAIRCGQRVSTWKQLDQHSNSLAHAMAERGVGYGDFVSLLLRDGIDMVTAAFACYKIGAIPQPLSTKLAVAELHSVLDLTNPKLVVTHTDSPSLPEQYLGASITQLLRSSAEADHLPSVISPSWKEPTSGGSTGRPKIILCATAAELPAFDAEAWQISGSDKFLMTAPLHHNAPFATTMTALFHGAEVAVLERFDEETVLEQVQTHSITWAYLVPTMMRRISALPEEIRQRYDLSSLEQLWHCAEPCPAWLKDEWIQWLGADRIWELYGGTEAQAGCTLSGAEWLEHRGSVGRPRWGEITIFDDQGQQVTEPGVIGEVYMRVPPGSAPTFRYIGAELEEFNGWSTLGDIGEFDEDGYLYLHDRRSDMITVGGVNVYPAEVEAALLEHPHVLSAAVIGLPVTSTGHRVHAIIQPSHHSLSVAEIENFLYPRLSRYKRPSTFELVQESLRDEAGKVRRSALRATRLADTHQEEFDYA